MLTTKTPRLVLLLVAFLVWTPAAYAWSWPVQGPVVQPFSYDPAHPYAAGQHRGIDIGADAVGESVDAPAAGTVSFAGTVPTSGKSVTIETSDGYSVTLTHLGSIVVSEGATVGEWDAIGTIGPSGTAEVEGPYVHLGIRLTADPDGYVDPLGLLPSAAADGGTDAPAPPQSGSSSSSTASGDTPSSSVGATTSTTPTKSESSDAGSGRASTTSEVRSAAAGHEHARTEESRSGARPAQSPSHAAVPHGEPTTVRMQRPTATRGHADVPTSSSRRPVVETAAPVERPALDAGHEIRWSAPVARFRALSHRTPIVLLPLILNGAAALVALTAVLVAARGRRLRRSNASPLATARVFDLPRRAVEHRPASRAA